MGKKFDKLEHKIAKEYEQRGKSHEEAEKIGKATAANIYRKYKK